MRGDILTGYTRLVVEECYLCGVPFAIPGNLRQQLLIDHTRGFWCPNGHEQFYRGMTEAQQERERAERAERRAASREEDLRVERLSHAATKGKLTKTKNRLANGVCPCCNRHFVNVERHMASQHPDYAAV